jgi:hypothetical protein
MVPRQVYSSRSASATIAIPHTPCRHSSASRSPHELQARQGERHVPETSRLALVNHPQQPPVPLEQAPQRPGDREYHVPVRHRGQDLLPQLLREQRRPLRLAAGTEVPGRPFRKAAIRRRAVGTYAVVDHETKPAGEPETIEGGLKTPCSAARPGRDRQKSAPAGAGRPGPGEPYGNYFLMPAASSNMAVVTDLGRSMG